MNKIFKVIYNKTKHCYVVVSELAKSHCKSTTESHTRRNKTALTAAVLLALGTVTFTAVPTVQATDSLFSNDYVGTNYKKDDSKSYSESETKNYHGAGAQGVGSNTLGMNAIAGKNTITIGDRDASAAQESVYIGARYDANNQVHPSSGKDVVSVGYGSDAAGTGSIAIGSGAAADSFDNAGHGTNPDKTSQSIAIGYNAQAKQNNIAIGAGSVATDAASTDAAYLTNQAAASSYVSVGGTVTTTDPTTKQTTTTAMLRRLTNVADGAAASDVATVGQLQALSDKVGVYDAGFGIKIDSDTAKKTNTISLNRNLGKDYDTTDDVNLKNDTAGTSLILGGRVEKGSPTGGQSVTGDYGALGKDSVTVGGIDNTVETTGDAAVVVGGIYNKAAGKTSAVVGGSANDAIGNESSVFGGQDNDAYETYATISGGSWNKAYGNASSIFGGSVNDVSGRSSVSVGGYGSHVYGDVSVGIAGGSTNADYALAAGNGAAVTVENGTAIGYQATADKEGTVAFGHDEGDVYYTSTWPQKATEKDGKYYDANNKEITKAQYEALRNADLTFNDYSQKPTVTENKYGSAAYNRLVKVADGKDAHDVVVMEQLDKAKNDLKVNAGWGISVADVTTKNNDGTETTTKNVISLNHNLGTNLDTTGHVYLDVSKTGLVLGTVVDGAPGTDVDLHFGATGDYAVTVGGGVNTASGKASVVLGGSRNTASEEASVASGGSSNVASGSMAAVYGGFDNEASGTYGAIFGGAQNKASNMWTTVGGGALNEASGTYASIWGGYGNKATDEFASIYGGVENSAYGTYSAILGGGSNKAGSAAVVSGGVSNEAAGLGSAVVGGEANIVTGANATALGGIKGSVNGAASVGILGGSTGINAPLTLAAGYQSTVTDTGVTSTPLSEEDVEKIIEAGGTHPGLLVSNNDIDNPSYKILDHFATAIGYQATADEAQTVAFGHDKGDTYYGTTTYTWKQKATVKDGHYYNEYGEEIDENSYKSLMNADGTWNDYSQPIATVEEKKYDSAYYNRLVKVADGIDDHDVVVMEQLKQYAEKDASNIGNNIKAYKTDENGNVQLDENKKPIEDKDATIKAQKANKDAWGKALGADRFSEGTPEKATDASTSDQMVTGKTLYNYDAPVAEGGKKLNYVSANNTTGQNLSALDAQVKANADTLNDKTHNIKYYSVSDNAPMLGLDSYSNAGNDGAKGEGSLAAGFVTHADGIASTVAGSYSGVLNQNGNGGFRGAAALSYGTFNVNQNTDAAKDYSGVANSIVGQANMTKDSNAAIIYGAGNTVTNSYRAIDTEKMKSIFSSLSDPEALSKALQDAVETSGGQVMVMGGGNSVDNAYMTQVVGVGNTVKGNQVQNTKGEWVTDTSNTAIKDYDKDKSSQYNYVDGFSNEVINGKHDYVIGANNTVTGDSYDDKDAKKYSNESNIIFGDNHTVTNTKNAVIIGSSDTQMTLDKGDNATAIGHNASAQRDALAVGVNTEARGNAVALGTSSTALNNSIAIGTKATAVSSQNLAIGWEAHIGNIKTDDEKIKNAIALGSDSQVRVNDLLESDNNRGVLSIGDTNKERRIIHVRAGVNDTDAVNVSQLKSAQNNLTDKGLIFAANSGDAYTAKLGSTVKIQGTDKKAGHEYTADNLTTEIDDSGNITILMDKNISADKIAVNGKDGKDAVSIAGKDGVGHIGLTGPAGTNGMNGADGKPGTSIDITVKNGYDDTAKGINGTNGVDGKDGITRIVYTDKTGEHQVATMEDGLKFKGDDTTVINKKLNNTLDIIGGADSTNLTDKNIGVNNDGGKLKVQLAKDLTGITSISNQKTIKVEGKDVTTGAKIDLGEDGSVNVNGGKITNVGSGIEKDKAGNLTEASKTNAANIGDVQSIAENTATDLTGKGLKFAANSGAEYTATLGSTVKIQGTDKKTNHEYTADNLTTEIDGNGNITILMDKNMSVEKLAVNGKDGKDGQPGTAGSIGIKGQDGKDGIGIDGKDGISIKGRDGKDGVTMKAVDG